jgi:hypothetical protein
MESTISGPWQISLNDGDDVPAATMVELKSTLPMPNASMVGLCRFMRMTGHVPGGIGSLVCSGVSFFVHKFFLLTERFPQ